MNSFEEFISFVKQSNSAGTSYRLDEKLSNEDKRTLARILLKNPSYLLFNEYDGSGTVWRWLLKHDYCLIVEYIIQRTAGYRTRWNIPCNKYDKNNGSSIFTDHSLQLSERLFDMLHEMGENFELYNKKTNETVLHMLAKQGTETATNILKNVVANDSECLDPDLMDLSDKTALHYALENGHLEITKILVERIGADWNLRSSSSVCNETLANKHPECVKFLQKCRKKYSIKPNSKGCDVICMICLLKMNHSAYLMSCCNTKVHTDCLRKYLARANPLCCFICRQKICKDLLDIIPNTVSKRNWEMELAIEARNAADPEEDFHEEMDYQQQIPDNFMLSQFETPVIFGFFNFRGEDIRYWPTEINRQPYCQEHFENKSLEFEQTYNENEFELPISLSSYESIPKNKVQDFLNILQDYNNLDLFYIINFQLFINRCVKSICDMNGYSSTSTFGQLLKLYIHKRIIQEGERNVLMLQLKRYHKIVCDGTDTELFKRFDIMVQWLHIRGLYINTQKKTLEMYTCLLKMLNDDINQDDFNRLMATIIDHIRSCLML